MMRKLHLSPQLALAADWMTMATVAYGARGSGKTSFGAVVAEELHKARQRFCVIDLKGDFWGLRASADGKGEGIPVVIFGGDHADVPLEPDAGKFLGELVASLEQSVVLDFEHMSKGKQIRFLGEFFAALYHANREPLLVIADEVQRYCPQRSFSPESNVTLGAVEDLVKLGRKHGLGVLLLSQRGAGLNKEVSEICDCLVAFRTPGSTDQERVRTWLSANGFYWPVVPVSDNATDGQVKAEVASFKNGEAIVASAHPDLNLFMTTRMRLRETFDSSATPKVGEKRREPKKLAAPELEAIKTKLADAIERTKANDPKELRKRVAELEKQLREGSRNGVRLGTIDTKELAQLQRDNMDLVRMLEEERGRRKIEEVPVLTEKDIERYEKACARLAKAIDKHNAEMAPYKERLAEAQQQILTKMAEALKTARVPMATSKPVIRRNAMPKAAERATPAPTNGEVKLKKGARLMLETLIAFDPKPLTRQQLGTFVKLPSHGSTFSSYLSSLRLGGYIEENGNVISPTRVANDVIGPVKAIRTTEELVTMWGGKLKKGAREMLAHLVERYPVYTPREDVAGVINLPSSGSTFSSYLSSLRTNELIEESGNDVRASSTLFPGVN
jgi:uncharacterized protein